MASQQADTSIKKAPRSAQKKRRLLIRRLKQRLAPIMFMVVAVALCAALYQFFLADGVKTVVNELRGKPALAQIGCSQDDEHPSDPKEVIAPQYQQYIRSQQPISASLIRNSLVKSTSIQAAEAASYTRSVIADWAVYEVAQELDGVYLRTTTTRSITDNEVAATWLMRDVPIIAKGTYTYGFEFRATVPVMVGIEYIMPDGSVKYQSVTELPAQKDWQQFTYYLRNDVAAESFRFVVVARMAGQVDLKAHSVHQLADARLSEGMVTIAFDDGWQSVTKALPLFDKYGLKTTQYIISEASTEIPVPGYMSAATVKDMQKNGHEIGSHTLTHCDQTNLSAQQIVRDAKESKNHLESRGLGPITSLAYPYGQHDNNTRQLIGEHYDFLRSSDAGYNDRYFDAGNVRSFGILDTTTDEDIKKWLDYAKENRVWIVLVYHRVDERGEYNVTSAQLDNQLKLIKQSGLKVKTFNDAASTARQ